MSNSETSANYNIATDPSFNGDDGKKMTVIRDYLEARIGEIENRMSAGSRSLFDFVDMAVVIGTLANLADNQNKRDTDQYVDFVRDEFFPVAETNQTMIATAFYCLMRCGLVHELSLSGHNIRAKRKAALKDFSIALTHDASQVGNWYSVDQPAKEVMFYAHELLAKTKSIVSKCFQPNSLYEPTIKHKLQTTGIEIIAIKS